MTSDATLKLFCLKWDKPVAEATCNICKDQCDNSIANPDNFIAKKLIVDLERVKGNRLKIHLFKKPSVELSIEKPVPESIPQPILEPAPEPTPEPVSEPEIDPEVDDFEAELNNMDFLKKEIEETFKDRADMIIESLGLAHMRTKDKDKEREEETT
ncbi:MAG: hypothetical protein MIO93_05685 [ANME-2 cluster archaeon]|nr:hypothetical protein [ANME-2 cluster archaeon]